MQVESRTNDFTTDFEPIKWPWTTSSTFATKENKMIII